MLTCSETRNAVTSFPETFVLTMEEESLIKKLREEFVKIMNK